MIRKVLEDVAESCAQVVTSLKLFGQPAGFGRIELNTSHGQSCAAGQGDANPILLNASQQGFPLLGFWGIAGDGNIEPGIDVSCFFRVTCEPFGSSQAFFFWSAHERAGAMGSKSSKQDPSHRSPCYGQLMGKDEALTAASSCEVLTTCKGLLRGKWAQFQAEAFYRAFPNDMAKTIRHILIAHLGIEKYAEREGEVMGEVELLGEGSFAKVLGLGPVAAKIISDTERTWVHRAAVSNALAADEHNVGPKIFGHGRVQQSLGGHFAGTVIFMERLLPMEDWTLEDMESLLEIMPEVSKLGFHNDLKVPNIMSRDGQLVLIDFDLLSPWSIKVAVSSSCIEHDFQQLLQASSFAEAFRRYYDLFSFSLTLQDGTPYRRLLKELLELWKILEHKVLIPLLEVGPKLTELPFEVLIRVPLRGVSVCLLDLRGNLFAHLDMKEVPPECLQLPQLVKSNGVYWP